MKNKNIWIVAALVILIVAVAAAAFLMPKTRKVIEDNPLPENITVTRTELPEKTEAPKATEEVKVTEAPKKAEEAEATEAPKKAEEAEATEAPKKAEEAKTTEASKADGEDKPKEPKAYLVITAAGKIYNPIPLLGDAEYKITQHGGVENVIEVTENSISMKSSTCDNQDCVKQGTVVVGNTADRLLGNMIVCLPNQVTLEIFTPEELAQNFEIVPNKGEK